MRAVCVAQPTDALSWGQLLRASGGAQDRLVGNARWLCVECVESRFPQSQWEQLTKDLEINRTAAGRAGKGPAHAIPKTVETTVKTTATASESQSVPLNSKPNAKPMTTHAIGTLVCAHPGRAGTLEERVLVRAPGRARQEMVREEAVEMAEVFSVDADTGGVVRGLFCGIVE